MCLSATRRCWGVVGCVLQQCSSIGARARGREGGFRVLAPRRRARRCVGHGVCCCAGVIPPHKTAAGKQAAACVDAEHSCAEQHSARQSKSSSGMCRRLSPRPAPRARARSPCAHGAPPAAIHAVHRPSAAPGHPFDMSACSPRSMPMAGPSRLILAAVCVEEEGDSLGCARARRLCFVCSFLGAVGWMEACVGCARLNVESLMNDWAR